MNDEGREREQDSSRSGGINVGRDVYAPGAAMAGRDLYVGSPPGVSDQAFNEAFAPLMEAVEQAPPEKKPEAEEKALALKKEVAKGEKASDGRMAELVNELVKLVPGAVSAVATVFGQPILAGLAGPVTKLVLDKMKGK